MKPWIFLLPAAVLGCSPDNPLFPDPNTPQGQCAIEANSDPAIRHWQGVLAGLSPVGDQPGLRQGTIEIQAFVSGRRRAIFNACMVERGYEPVSHRNG